MDEITAEQVLAELAELNQETQNEIGEDKQ
jgi:hypothetical protein